MPAMILGIAPEEAWFLGDRIRNAKFDCHMAEQTWGELPLDDPFEPVLWARVQVAHAMLNALVMEERWRRSAGC